MKINEAFSTNRMNQMDNVNTDVVIEYVKWSIELPLKQADAVSVFASKIAFCNNAPPTIGTNSSFVMHGIAQVDLILFGAEITIGCEPDLFSVSGTSHNEKVQLDWGTPTWRIAENLLRGYEASIVYGQRYNLLKEQASTIATIEPFVRPEGTEVAVSPIVDRLNIHLDSLGDAKFLTHETVAKIASPTKIVVGTKHKFAQPMRIERGIPIQLFMTVVDDVLHSEIIRHATRSASYLPGGRISIGFNIFGLEEFGPKDKRPKTINGIEVVKPPSPIRNLNQL
jgi:hypothetical protein